MSAVPLTPQQLAQFLNWYGDAQDATTIANTAATQGLQNLEIQTLSTICSNTYGSLLALPVAGAAAGTLEVAPPVSYGLVVLSWEIEQTYAKVAENACTQAFTSIVQGLNSSASSLGQTLDNIESAFVTTTQQANDFAALSGYASSGNLAGAIAAANQFISDSNFVGLTVSSTGISYQQGGVTLTATTNWQPEQLTIQNTDGSSDVTTYNLNGGATAFTSDYYNSSSNLFATVNGNTDSSGSISANGHLINYAAGATPTIAQAINGGALVNITPSSSTESPITLDLGSSGIGVSIGSNFSENIANTQAAIDAVGDVNFVSNAGNPVQTLAPTSDGGVTQSLYSSSITDQLTQKNFLSADGTLDGSVAFSYGSGSSTIPSAGAITNGSNQTLGSFTANADGSITLVNIDPTTGDTILTTTVDVNGHTTQQTVNPSANYPAFVQAIADTLATQLITSVLIKNNLPATIAAQAFADAVIHSSLPTTGQNLTFAEDFAQSTFDIAGGIGGSLAGSEIATALGLPGEFGVLTGGVTGNLVTQALVNNAYQALGLTNGSGAVLTVANFASGIGGAGGALVGSTLAGLLLTPTLAGEVTGAVATAAELANVADLIDVLAVSNPLTAVLTAFSLALGSDFIGNIVGDVISDIFGSGYRGVPDGITLLNYSVSTNSFSLGATGIDNNGDPAVTQAMATAAASSLNAVLKEMGGTLSNVPAYGYGYIYGIYTFGLNDPTDYGHTYSSSDPNSAVEAGVFATLKQSTVTGGNPYMEYALQHSTATTLTGLVSDLNAARDYSLYVATPLAFDLALAMSGDSTQLTTWQTELAQAHTLGLDQLTAGELQSLSTFGAVVSPTSLANYETIQGNGFNFTGDGAQDYFVRNNSTLQVSVVEFDANDNPTLVENLTTLTGAAALINPAAQVIGTGYNFAGLGGHDYFTRDVNTDQVTAWEYNAAGQWVYGGVLTTLQGQPFLASATEIVIGTGYNFAGLAGHDFFTRDSVSGQVIAWEFNGSGQWTYGGVLTNGSNQPFTLSGTAEVVGTGFDFVGLGGHNIVSRDTVTGQIAVNEFNSSGAFIGGNVLTQSNGTAFIGDVNITIIDTPHGILGSGDDIIVQTASNQLTISEFNSSGQFTSSFVLTEASGQTPVIAQGGSLSAATANELIIASNASVTVGSGASGALLLGSGNTISVANGDTFNLRGSSDTITLGSNDILNINSGVADIVTATSDTINTASNVSMTLNGGGDTVNGASGDTITLTGVGQTADNVINMSGGTVNAANGVQTDIDGNGNTILAGQHGNIGLAGMNDVITATSDNIWLNSGSAAINGGGDTVYAANGTTVTVSGVGETADVVVNIGSGTVDLGNSVQADVDGNNNTIVAGTSDNLGTAGTNDVITATNSNIWVNSGSATLNGGGDTVFAANGTTVTVSGVGQTADDNINIASGTVHISNTAQADVYGNGDTVIAGNNDNFGVHGSNEVVTAGTSDGVFDVSGNGTTINASNDYVSIASGLTNISVTGNSDTIQAGTGDNFNVSGSGDTMIASNDTLYLNASTTNITIQGSHDTIHIRSGDTYTIQGSSDTVITDTVVTASNGSTIASYNGTSTLVDITGLPYDSSITASYTNSGHTLVVTDHGSTVDSITLTSETNEGTLTVRSDGSGGTLIVDPPFATLAAGASPIADGFIFNASALTGPQRSSSDYFEMPSVGNSLSQTQWAHQFTMTGGEMTHPLSLAADDPQQPQDNYPFASTHGHDGFHLV